MIAALKRRASRNHRSLEGELRNILTGTRPQPSPDVATYTALAAVNGDANKVLVDGRLTYLPNNVDDASD